MRIPQVTLEQWAALKAVVDLGSFAKAAEELNKSQSSISYALAKLEQQLPTPVLQQQGRKAVLTDAGKVLYRYASSLLAQAQTLESQAIYLASGWQAEVTIAVDMVVDMKPVIQGLDAFSQQHPNTRIRLLETSLSGTDDALLERQADMIYGVRILPGFLGRPVAQVDMPCVVAPQHPLAQMDGAITSDELKSHRQIVVRDSGRRRSMDAGWLQAEQRWTVTYFGTSANIVKQGMGFAFLPRSQVKAELESGELVELQLVMEARRQLNVSRVLTEQEQANPAVKEVARFIDDAFSD